MRVSPGPRTRTCPSVNTAISEFVVPKSIPAINSLIVFSCRLCARYLHLGRTEYLAIPFVAASVHLDHRAFGNGVRFFALDGVHSPRIEEPPFTADLSRIEFFQSLI